MEIMDIIAAVASVVSALVLIVVLIKLIGMSNAPASSQIVDAKELAKELGGAIEAAFRQYVPQPEKLASALTGIVDQAAKKASDGVEAANKAIQAGQEKAAEKLAGQEKSLTANLDTARKALDEASTKLGSTLSTATDKIAAAAASLGTQLDKTGADFAVKIKGSMEPAVANLQTALTAHAGQLEKTEAGSREQLKSILTQHSDSVQKSLAGSNDQLKSVLAQHAESLQKASTAIASQLDKIMALEKDIQQVLHVQQVTDGTLKAVAATEEFKQTMTTLRQHLTASDNLIKEVTKPRTIRLVESET